MRSKKRSSGLAEWREIAGLGEQLVGAESLSAQRDRIRAMTARILHGTVEVWLQDKLFRLPDWKAVGAFPSQPRGEALRRAVARRKPFIRRAAKRGGRQGAVIATPIEDHGLVLGALQVARRRGPNFEERELELLVSIASVVAVGLYAWHRVEVERFRLGELNLVGQVSAEISNVLNLDELARRVTELIQKAFNYYYVAIFTFKAGAQQLRFRSSASALRKGGQKAPLALEVQVGQGLIGEAASTGELIAAPDVRAEARYRFAAALPETRSEVAIPLKLRETVLGVLDVQSDRLNAFHPNDLLVLRALADNVARAVEGARLYNDVRRRADQLSLVADVSRSVISTLDLGEMMKEAAILIQERSGFPYVSLFSVHPNRRLIEFEAGSGKRRSALQGYTIRMDDPQGIIPWVARAGQTVLANDVEQDGRYRPSPMPPKNTRAELTVPLAFGDRVLGVLDIQSDKLNAFTEDDRLTFEAVGGTIAASIRNADLYRSEKWRRQVADSLREVAGLLSEHVGIDEALEAILTELEHNLPVQVSLIWLLDRGELRLAAVHGVTAEAVAQARLDSPEAETTIKGIMSSVEPVIRKIRDPAWPAANAAGFTSNYSGLAAPLRVNEQPVGIITLAHPEPGRYGHEARAMAATFASYAAVAIENARLYDATQEQAYASAALLQVSQALTTPGDLRDVLGGVLRSMPMLVGVERSALYGWDATRRNYTPMAASGLGDESRAALLNADFGEGRFALLDAATAAAEERVLVLQPADTAASWTKRTSNEGTRQALADGERLLIATPLISKQDVMGVLVVEESRGRRRSRARRLEIIRGVAQQIAGAMQNDLLEREMVARERLETEVELAREIQRTLIPQSLPTYAGWELAARWQTAREVGGDFYDVVTLPKGRLGLFIADVADKGVPAALFMTLTRALFRAAALEAGGPGDALQQINDLLIPDTRQGMFVTAVYGILDPGSGAFTYANAGHNPPLLIRPEAPAEKLVRTGMALGVLASASIAENSVEVKRGESILLYTDGVTEAFSPEGELFGEERLFGTVRREASSSANDLLGAIESDLSRFLGSSALSDDLTMLAIRRT